MTNFSNLLLHDKLLQTLWNNAEMFMRSVGHDFGQDKTG